MFKSFYKGKRVLITGHTGFKGTWLTLWLKSLGANVCGYSLAPNTSPSMFKELKVDTEIESVIGNILDQDLLNQTFEDFNPEIVFHLAAQPIVRFSYREPILTYETNVIGSLTVLEAARKCGTIKAFVNVTTDKVYENNESGKNFEETDPFGGYDPYSSSKGCVEIMSASYRNSFLQDDAAFAMATARAGNVIGGGDWALDRLVPDCIRSINKDIKIEIRNPLAVRPWQHVLEPLSGYMLLAEKLYTEGKKYASGFNFGPKEDSVLTVTKVSQKITEYYGKGDVVVHKADNLHEAKFLMLSIKKAKQVLNWEPVLTADEAIKNTVLWYKKFYAGENMQEFTLTQINDFQEKAKL